MNVLEKIVRDRRRRIESQGPTLGARLPEAREHPVVPFCRPPFVICEIKRRSPSRGNIKTLEDPVLQAKDYVGRGATTLSVLTEQDHFAGSLQDLVAVKRAFPGTAVLRKDFLLLPEEIDVSFRAGADAVLLIASILDQTALAALFERAMSLGLTPFVELHDADDAAKVRRLQPGWTGINARDLQIFSVDLTVPARLLRLVDWRTSIVFESGIHGEEEARFAASAGFDGVLVGEAVMKEPDRVTSIIGGFRTGLSARRKHADQDTRHLRFFWNRLYRDESGKTSHADGEKCEHVGDRSAGPLKPRPRSKAPRRPLVKICGLTTADDARYAARSGADVLGFIFADSPRRADPRLLEQIADLETLKAGVVVLPPGIRRLPEEVGELFSRGFLDVIQFHGDEGVEDCAAIAFPYYKALRLRAEGDVATISAYRSPRVLIDAFSAGAYGGTGRRIDADLVEAAGRIKPLWLAGGLSPENIGAIIEAHNPELVDLSSSLERSPGVKDHDRIDLLFERIRQTEGAGEEA